MEIGRLIIETSGLLLFKDAAEKFVAAMDSILKSVSEKYEVDWRRFEYWSATTYFSVPISDMWRHDTILKTLRREMNKNFSKWAVFITITIHEKGG